MRPLLILACLGLTALNIMAMRGSPDRNEYLSDHKKIRNRSNYALQMARARDQLGNIDNTRISVIEPFDSNTNPEELSALIVDYANMIRNDGILLDNSDEIRTRERGNIKVEKKYNQAIPDPPCSCKYKVETKDLGELFYPRFVETRNCNEQQTCLAPSFCTETYYNVTILKKKMYTGSRQESLELPKELKFKWMAEKLPISVGCVCTNEYELNAE